MNQPPQHFCTNCGQPLAHGTAFCVSCGTQMDIPSAAVPGSFAAGMTPGYPPSYTQAPAQNQDDLLLAGLLVGSGMSRRERRLQRRARRGPRRPGTCLRGCGCFLLILALLAGPFIGAALTTGALHQIFVYVAVGMLALLTLLLLIGALATRTGREMLAEGLIEALLEGLFGG